MKKSYYRPFRLEDLHEALNLKLRQADIDEIENFTGVIPSLALQFSILCSKEAYVVIHESKIEGVFGVSQEGIIWFVATDKFKDFSFEFTRQSKKFIQELLWRYPILYNWVSTKNKESVKWLEWLGFNFDKPTEKDFMYFYKKAEGEAK